jgi:hypothetical protein
VKVVIKMSGVSDKKYKLITREAQYDSDKNFFVGDKPCLFADTNTGHGSSAHSAGKFGHSNFQ